MAEQPPGFIPPMLAVSGTAADLRHDGFAYEFKWDGVRAIVEATTAHTRAWSRKGAEITARYPELAEMGAATATDVILDGEIVAFDAASRPSFSRLQRRMNLSNPARVPQVAREVPVAFLAFDVLWCEGASTQDQPYERRRGVLEGLGLVGPAWRVPPHLTDDPAVILQAADELGLEGVVAKRLASPYRSGRRSPDWIKYRLMRREEFVVGGYRPGQGGRSGQFGSLLLGYHDEDGALRFAGSVGSGFTASELDRLQRMLDRDEQPEPPFVDPVPHRDAVFVRPRLVVEVRFSEWTPDGVLRQPSYKGQRDDKSPEEVVIRRGHAGG